MVFEQTSADFYAYFEGQVYQYSTYVYVYELSSSITDPWDLFTHKSDFAFGLQINKTNTIFFTLKWTSLFHNRALKLDM